MPMLLCLYMLYGVRMPRNTLRPFPGLCWLRKPAVVLVIISSVLALVVADVSLNDTTHPKVLILGDSFT